MCARLLFPYCYNNFCIFWKKILDPYIPYMFLSIYARQTWLCFVSLKKSWSECVHGICFFNRTWHNHIVLIFPHIFWEFLFIRVNSCHLAYFVWLSCCKSCTMLQGENQNPLVPLSRLAFWLCPAQGSVFWHSFFSLWTKEANKLERFP